MVDDKAMAKRSKTKPASVAPAASRHGTTPAREIAAPGWALVLLRAAVIVAAAFWVYSPVFHGAWLWDDDWYITNQPLVRDLAGLGKFWFHPGSWVEYYPIEETLLWIEWHLWGNDTLGYHLTTIALHAANALLVWRLLGKLGLGKAWIGGLIFAIHPAAVDSVAWIAETKNTLALAPFFLAMGAWIDYDDRRRPHDFALALGFFLVAMLCKITAAPFPAVILLYAWWKRGRIDLRDLAASGPFFAVSLVLGSLTIACGPWYYQSLGEVPETTPQLDGAARVALAGESIGVYFAHVFWPVGLLPNYPQWKVDPSTPWPYLAWIALGGALFALWRRRETWGRTALLGLGFFLLFLAPFVGFVSVSYMNFTWVMDHFLYIPIIGIIGLFVAALESIENRLPASRRALLTGATTVVVALLAFVANGYAVAYVDEATLWGYTVEHNPDDWLAQENLGKALLLLNEPEEAAVHLRESLRVHPDHAETHSNLGRALVAMDRVPEGIEEQDQAIRLAPTDAANYNQKGVALLQAGRIPEAQAQFEKALELRPQYTVGLENLGIALAQNHRLPEAIERFEAALKLAPGDANLHVNLGKALTQLGRNDEAAAQFREALRLDPANAPAREALEKLPPGGTRTP
jgi:Flp pilus assembly protein TadD